MLLDEPTNHLDVTAVEWLEEFLQSYPSAYVIISHDRYFLDRACRRIVELENGRAASYTGNYSDLSGRARRATRSAATRLRQPATTDRQDRRVHSPQSRRTENQAGQVAPHDAGETRTRRRGARRSDRPAIFACRSIERTGNHVLTVNEAADRLSGQAAGARHFFHSAARRVSGHHWPERIRQDHVSQDDSQEDSAAGRRDSLGHKSSDWLLRAAARRSRRSKRDHHGVAARCAARARPPASCDRFWRSFFSPATTFTSTLRDLSGGEKGRLALAKLIYSRVNVLVLDEPTNHLDIPSREALEEALDAYEGTIMTISHDRYFLDRVATQILALDGAGGAEHYDGDYTEYHDWKASRLTPGVRVPGAREAAAADELARAEPPAPEAASASRRRSASSGKAKRKSARARTSNPA